MSTPCQAATTPVWPGLLGVGVTLLIGAAATWVAYNQFRIAQANLRLALFERRFAVLERVREFLYLATRAGDVDSQAMSVLLQARLDAPFLFGDEVVKRLDELYETAVQLQLNNLQLRDPAIGDGPTVARDKVQALGRMVKEFEEIPKLLRPYMGFDEWRLKTPGWLTALGGALRLFKRGGGG